MKTESTEALIQFETKFLQDIGEKVAKSLSPYPDTSEPVTGQLKRRIWNGRQALLIIFISTFRPYWETDRIIRIIGNKAYLGNYEGVWSEVQDFLENYESDPRWFLKKYLEYHSPESFFGNFLGRRLDEEIEKCSFALDFPKPYSLPPVRRPVRRRGYDDKGSLRLPHEDHGDPPVKTDKVDRRAQIHHPLLE